MRQVLKTGAWIFAIVVLLIAGALVLKACGAEPADSERTEVTPVLEATQPETTGPAESEEETVADLPATGGIKLVGGE